jgi:alcohol dehydrogenase (cytochrome c)
MNQRSNYSTVTVVGIVGGLIFPAGIAGARGVAAADILNASAAPENWLTYSGSYMSQRHTLLDDVDRDNVEELELKWVFQAQSLEAFETTPLVVDGIMYLTEAPNTAIALDADTGRVFWRYQYDPSTEARPCCGRVNRGLAILGDKVFMATLDAELIAIDAKTGQPVWQKNHREPEPRLCDVARATGGRQ